MKGGLRWHVIRAGARRVGLRLGAPISLARHGVAIGRAAGRGVGIGDREPAGRRFVSSWRVRAVRSRRARR